MGTTCILSQIFTVFKDYTKYNSSNDIKTFFKKNSDLIASNNGRLLCLTRLAKLCENKRCPDDKIGCFLVPFPSFFIFLGWWKEGPFSSSSTKPKSSP